MFGTTKVTKTCDCSTAMSWLGLLTVCAVLGAISGCDRVGVPGPDRRCGRRPDERQILHVRSR